jgi:hypothetical protein
MRPTVRWNELELKAQKVPGLERKPKKEGGYFEDLSPELRGPGQVSSLLTIEMKRRSGKPVTGWFYPILVDQARRLAKNHPKPFPALPQVSPAIITHPCFCTFSCCPPSCAMFTCSGLLMMTGTLYLLQSRSDRIDAW